MGRNSKGRTTPCRISHSDLSIASVSILAFYICVLTSLFQYTEAFASFHHCTPSRGNILSQSSIETSESETFLAHSLLKREEAQSIINDVIMPQDFYGDRIGLGRDAQGIDAGTALDPNDPRLSMTYAEFPLTSLDQLMDFGLQYKSSSSDEESKGSTTTCIDIGSGCGRIGLYLVMTRGGSDDTVVSDKSWKVHGIEISDLLHHEAGGYCQRAVENNLISREALPSSTSSDDINTLSLHLGPAEDFASLLSEADIIFAYSTAFTAKIFSPELGALILGPEWSQMLGKSCKEGCMAITTDRALDPAFGWKLVDRLDVENREVFGTTGYVHILKKV